MTPVLRRGLRTCLLAALAIALCGSAPALAADFTIGSSDTQSFVPFGDLTPSLRDDVNDGTITDLRYQQAYNPEEFDGPTTIVGVEFYGLASQLPGAGLLGEEWSISLSTGTNPVDDLDPDFDNVGADAVSFGSNVLLDDAFDMVTGSLLFDDGVFAYDPSLGPLLIDIFVPGPFTSSDLTQGEAAFFFDSTDPAPPGTVCRVNTVEVWTSLDNTCRGLVTGFFVPEPGTFSCVLGGLAALAGLRRRRIG